jgi:polysaccharide pyruvyl transferase WcaK-like protein
VARGRELDGGDVITSLISNLWDKVSDPDRILMRAMGSLIDAAAVRHALNLGDDTYREGNALKLLLAGYSGMRNTGADVRVEEMIRQLRTVFGEEQLELSLLSIDPALSAGYFRGVRQVRLPNVFPKFLFDECQKHNGVIACEGSMFKSKFANALSVMMAGALGLASVEGKLSVGYGAEAGAMEPALQDFVRKRCKRSLVICRNDPSRDVLEGMGIRTKGGTDTAWTFEPAPLKRGTALLRDHGWDGVQKLLVVCPINPYWWPIRPDLVKAAAHRVSGQFAPEHYRSLYFHEWNTDAAQKYDAYLSGLAEATSAFSQERGAFVAVVGTEMLDRQACEALAARLPAPAPVLVSDEFDMYELVSVLRNAALLVSSRYHAIVTSMAGGVPSLGVTMDERIHNLMHDRGHAEFLLRVDDVGLGDKLLDALRQLDRDAERVRQDVLRFVPGQIRMMGQMGMDLADEVKRVYPGFPLPNVPRSFEHFLPPLSPDLARLMGEYA